MCSFSRRGRREDKGKNIKNNNKFLLASLNEFLTIFS